MSETASTTSTASDTSAIAARIASAGSPRTATTESTPAAALATANAGTASTEAARPADSEQPETSTDATSQTVETEARKEDASQEAVETSEATKDSTAEAQPSAEKPTEPAPQPDPEAEDRRIAELLGLSEVEPTKPEELRKKYRESSREAHALRDRLSKVQEFLGTLNVELVQDSEGNLGLKAKDGYDPKVDIEDLEQIITDDFIEGVLSADDKKSKLRDLTKTVAAKMLSKYPKATARQGVLPGEVQTRVFAELVHAKLSDGSERYPGMNTPEYKRVMAKIFHDPTNRSLAEWMHNSPGNYRRGMHAIYHEAYRVLGSINPKAKAETAQPHGQKKAGVQVSAAGSGGPNMSKVQNITAKDAAKTMAERIARAVPR